jgi:hypothetical protein
LGYYLFMVNANDNGAGGGLRGERAQGRTAAEGAGVSELLPQRTAGELAQALRSRASYLTGEPWEADATAAMMREAADMLTAHDRECDDALVELVDAVHMVRHELTPETLGAIPDIVRLGLDSKLAQALRVLKARGEHRTEPHQPSEPSGT